MLTTRGDGRAVALGIGLTILFTIYRVLENFGIAPDTGIDDYYTAIFGHILMFVIGYALAALLPRRDRDLTNLTVWTQTGEPLK
jgi:SSS family solute:Na+ symporter